MSDQQETEDVDEQDLLDRVSDEAILQRARQIKTQKLRQTREVEVKCRAKSPEGEDHSCGHMKAEETEISEGVLKYKCKKCGGTWTVEQGQPFNL